MNIELSLKQIRALKHNLMILYNAIDKWSKIKRVVKKTKTHEWSYGGNY